MASNMGRSSTTARSSSSPTLLFAVLMALCQRCVVIEACSRERIYLDGSQSEAVIKSRYYPENYPPNTDCNVYITAPEGKKVRLYFVDFELEAENSLNQCSFDSLVVYDGDSDTDLVFGTFCGTPTPPVLVSSGRYMYIHFETDGTVEEAGFKAVAQRVDQDYQEPLPTSSPDSCFTVLEEDNGNFYSPDFPGTYAHNIDCSYIIILPDETDTVMLRFTSFDLEPSQSCVYDYVEVRDGVSLAAPLIGRYCGGVNNKPSGAIEASGSVMYVLFHTDISAAFEGFYAEYTSASIGFIPSTWNDQADASSTSVCDISRAILTNRGGFIVSHDSYPDGTYDHHLQCSVQIAGSREYESVFINFLVVDLPESPNCGGQYSDHVEVFSGQLNSERTSLGTVCESDTAHFETSSQYAIVRFRTDGAANEGHSGFRALYAVYYEDNYGCEDDDYHCENNHCIASFLVCDGYDHCGDDSDEEKGCHAVGDSSWGVVMGIVAGCALLIGIGICTAWCCMNLPTRANTAASQPPGSQPGVAVISSNGTTQPYIHPNPTFNPGPSGPAPPQAEAASLPPKYSDIWKDPINTPPPLQGGGNSSYPIPPSPAPTNLYSQRELAYASAPPPNPAPSLDAPVLPPVQFQSAAAPRPTGGATGGSEAGRGTDGALGRAEIIRGGALPPLRGAPGRPTGLQ